VEWLLKDKKIVKMVGFSIHISHLKLMYNETTTKQLSTFDTPRTG